MIAESLPGLVCGGLCLTASACVGAHEILLGPDRPNYPDASRRLRAPMFVWSAVLMYRGVELIAGALRPVPPAVTLGVFMGSAMVTVVHGLLLEAHLRQWLPARVHARIRHLLYIATCGRARAVRRARERQNANPAARAGFRQGSTDPAITAVALVELSRQGVVVIGPLEGPDALVEDPLMGDRR